MENIRLSQNAPWNRTLSNSYRTRWAEVQGRYFKVSAEARNTVWVAEEVDFNGDWREGNFLDVSVTMRGARQKIADELGL